MNGTEHKHREVHFLNRLQLFLSTLWIAREIIASAAATFRISDKYAALNESQDVTQRGIVGTCRELRPFRCCEFPLEAVEEAVHY